MARPPSGSSGSTSPSGSCPGPPSCPAPSPAHPRPSANGSRSEPSAAARSRPLPPPLDRPRPRLLHPLRPAGVLLPARAARPRPDGRRPARSRRIRQHHQPGTHDAAPCAGHLWFLLPITTLVAVDLRLLRHLRAAPDARSRPRHPARQQPLRSTTSPSATSSTSPARRWDCSAARSPPSPSACC